MLLGLLFLKYCILLYSTQLLYHCSALFYLILLKHNLNCLNSKNSLSLNFDSKFFLLLDQLGTQVNKPIVGRLLNLRF